MGRERAIAAVVALTLVASVSAAGAAATAPPIPKRTIEYTFRVTRFESTLGASYELRPDVVLEYAHGSGTIEERLDHARAARERKNGNLGVSFYVGRKVFGGIIVVPTTEKLTDKGVSKHTDFNEEPCANSDEFADSGVGIALVKAPPSRYIEDPVRIEWNLPDAFGCVLGRFPDQLTSVVPLKQLTQKTVVVTASGKGELEVEGGSGKYDWRVVLGLRRLTRVVHDFGP